MTKNQSLYLEQQKLYLQQSLVDKEVIKKHFIQK